MRMLVATACLLATTAVAAATAERVPRGEAAAIAEVKKLTTERFLALYRDGHTPVLRDAHPKMHGLVRAEFIVEPGLPKELRHGVLREARTYPAWIRFSASSETPRSDRVPDGHGMAIKLMDVGGDKLLDGERGARTQDFVMINHPTFFVRDVADYVTFNRALASGGGEAWFAAHPAQAAAAQAIIGHVVGNPLQSRYWSQTPYALGPDVIKFSARPTSAAQDPVPAGADAEFLHDAMRDTLANGDVTFDFLVQVRTDAATMPVEDALVEWDEARAPFRKVATIRIPRQAIDADGRAAFGENLSFTPWHSLPSHRPLGGINRARRTIYESISTMRHARNGTPRREPAPGEGPA